MNQRHPHTKTVFSAEEYLLIDDHSDIKHELIDGTIYMMAGATVHHNMIQRNVSRALFGVLDDSDCVHFAGDMRVHVESYKNYVYPDVVVYCGDIQLQPDVFDTLTNPLVVVEITSKETASYDRGDKAAAYLQIATLRDYLIIAHDTVHTTHHYRSADGDWHLRETIGRDSTIALPAIGLTVALAELYRNVTLDE